MDTPPFVRELCIIESQDYSKTSLEGCSFISCTFSRCDFTETLLYNTKFCSCRFEECNFTLSKVDGCRFQEVQFVGCKMVGVDFFKCATSFFTPAFVRCLMRYCNFSEMPMKKVSFHSSKVFECHFINTQLAGADFAEADLSGSQFHNCDLSKANFATAMNYQIDSRTNTLKNAAFSLPEALALLRGLDITIV